MKAKRYTKKQIVEAIAFWKKILENKSPLLDSLVDEFGYGIVFNDVPVHATLKMFKTLFKHINAHMFNNKLAKWPFIKNDAECEAKDAICGYVHSLLSNLEKQQYDVVLRDTMVDGELYLAPHYAFHSFVVDGHECTLAFAASLLAHEMIHQYNFECEDEGKNQWLAIAYGKDYDEHGTNFERWMDIANSKYGLCVQKHGHGSLRDISSAATSAMKDFAGNDYKMESEKLEKHNGHTILKHTPDFSAIMQIV